MVPMDEAIISNESQGYFLTGYKLTFIVKHLIEVKNLRNF